MLTIIRIEIVLLISIFENYSDVSKVKCFLGSEVSVRGSRGEGAE
jgi:hypothetical protein